MGKMVSGVILSVVLIIFASGAVAFYTIFFRPEGQVAVPLLRDSSVVDAVAEAERLGLVVQLEKVESKLPEGRVLAQSPEAGTRLRKGQTVVLQVSRSGELHAVPDVRGQNLAQAQTVIREQGFMLGDVIRVPFADVSGGVVIAQSPASPANISVTRKIDLLVREGGEGKEEGTVPIPDVNRLTEREARKLLEDAGLKVQAIDRVYSPVMPEGLAIETRPGAGTAMKPGEGVRLKIATQTRPAGYTEATAAPEGNGSARRVTSQPTGNQPAENQPPAPAKPQPGVTISVPGQGDIRIGDGTPTTAPIREADPNVSVIDQERQKPRIGAETPAPPRPSAVTPSTPAQPTPSTPSSSGGGSRSKTARIRYQVPPLTSPLNLRIELADPSGKRDILNRPAKSGESVSVEAPYTQECVVSIYLGGDFVWQEKHR
ncbi:MAG: PASTA domain-containing protein [Synergistaceae bacterium]|nr:PASTA domain-containing protein [Synergistaceae bacterium]